MNFTITQKVLALLNLEIIRRHITLHFEPKRNHFSLERVRDDKEQQISFFVEHSPPIKRKENVIGTLSLLPSYYFRPSGDTFFTWEINKPLTLLQVIQSGSFGICCILKDPTTDAVDYA